MIEITFYGDNYQLTINGKQNLYLMARELNLFTDELIHMIRQFHGQIYFNEVYFRSDEIALPFKNYLESYLTLQRLVEDQ